MKTLYLDFETYYDKTFSLSRMTTQEYITDSRFEVLMMSVAMDDSPVAVLDAEVIPSFLSLLDPNETCVVSHNSVFDQLILSHHYGFVPALAGDTMALARAMGWHVAAGGGSLDALTRALGEALPDLDLPHKGTAVINALGKRRGDFTDKEWAEYKDYCKTDTVLLRQLWLQLIRYAKETTPETNPDMTTTEIVFENLIIKCATNPRLKIDAAVIDRELEDLEVRRVQILTDIQERLGVGTLDEALAVLRSDTKFAALLESMGAVALHDKGAVAGDVDSNETRVGVTIPQKVSKTTGKWTWAFSKTDAGMQELAQCEDEAIATVVNARLGTKSSIAQTRAMTFKRLAEDGFLAIPYLIHGAHTSRMSGRDINCQNLPSGRVKNQSKALRQSIVPRDDNQQLVVADASQIEVRVAAYIANNQRTLDAFAQGKDVYVMTASGLYQEDYDSFIHKVKVKEDPEYKLKRQVAKAAELSCQFGTGDKAFRNYAKVVGKVELTEEQARTTVRTWREVNWPIVETWNTIENVLYQMIQGERGYFGGINNNLFYFDGSRHVLGKHMPGIRMPSGLWINYRGLTTQPGQWPDGSPKTDFVFFQNKGKHLKKTYTYAAKVFENCVQGTAFQLMIWQAVNINNRYPISMNNHDEWVVVTDKPDEALDYMIDCMSTAPPWLPGITLAAEGSIASNYGDAK